MTHRKISRAVPTKFRIKTSLLVDLTPTTIALIMGTLLIAGSVKGLIGVGLPTVSVALLINVISISNALAIIVIPAIVANIWQAAIGEHGRPILKRFWPLLLCLCITTWFGVEILAGSDQGIMSGVFGFVLFLYATISLTRPTPPPPGRSEIWLSPIIGAVNGVLNGLTGSYVVPGVLYMQALGLRRDELIQAMGILFLTSTLALGISLAGHEVMDWSHVRLSAAALIPALTGYAIGQHFRRKLPEEKFRRVFFVGLLLLGAYTFATRIILAGTG